MSAILDALKKLEGDAEFGSGSSATYNAGDGFSRVARHINARPGFLIAGGIVLLCLFGTAIWHTAILVAPGQDRPAEAGGTASDSVPPGNQAETGKKDFPLNYATNFEAEKDDEKPSIKAKKTEKPGDLPPAVSESKTSPQFGIKPRTGTEPEPEPTAESQPEAEILQDKSLSLQAVSWSSSPQKRFVVINGRICREGERVGEYQIRRIDAEEVLLTGSSGTWRLVFDKR
ncbi:MAG: general secretion pathway protein GspB [Desulfosalsimonas sp.]